MADKTLTPTINAVLARVGDERAAQLDILGWLHLFSRASDRLTPGTVERLTMAGADACALGVPLPIVLGTWMAVGGHAAQEGVPGHALPRELRLLDEGTQALAAGYVAARENAVHISQAMRTALLEAVLSDTPAEVIADQAASLGIDLSSRYSVLVVGQVSLGILDRFRDASVLAGPHADTTVAIVSGRVPRGSEPAGLGRPGLGIAGIRQSFGEAQRALAIAERLRLRGIVPYYDVLPEALLSQDQAMLAELVETTLGVLRSTRQATPQYLETAATWLQEGLSVAATARVLQVHERTVRYRLARIAKLTGLDLRHADDRFRLELAIRGDRLLNPPD